MIMKNKILWLEIIGFVFTVVFSFVFHFMYKWIGTFGWLFPINESVWEHIKIIFMPYLIYSFIECMIIKPVDRINFLAIKSIALIIMPILMIVLEYTYVGVIGNNYMALDIIVGILTILAGYVISYRLIIIDYKVTHRFIYLSLAFLTFLLLIFFTYMPPHINLFYDKLLGIYGKP